MSLMPVNSIQTCSNCGEVFLHTSNTIEFKMDIKCSNCNNQYFKGYAPTEYFTTGVNYEIERLRKGIITAMNTTHDDYTHEFLDRVLKGNENEAPSYRVKVEDE